MLVKTICISGASAGIGAAAAFRFAKDHHTLILGARRTDKLKEVAEECLNLGARAVHCLDLDVTSGASVDAFAKKALDLSNNRIDVLLNNAGLAVGTDHIKDGKVDDWELVINTNVVGLLRLTRAILPSMVSLNSGHLLFLSSIAAHQVYEGGAVYAASKHAVRAIAQTLKLELNGKNIRVSTIDPGMVETDFSMVRFSGDAEKAKSVYRGMQPLTGADIADCLAYIVNAPAHVNIDQVILTPVAQATVYKVSRA